MRAECHLRLLPTERKRGAILLQPVQSAQSDGLFHNKCFLTGKNNSNRRHSVFYSSLWIYFKKPKKTLQFKAALQSFWKEYDHCSGLNMERSVQPLMCLEKEFQREGAAMEKTLSPWSCAWSWMLETGGWHQRSEGCGERCGSIAGQWSGYAGLCEWGEGHWIESFVRQGVNRGSGGQGWCGWRSRSGCLNTTCFLSLFYYGDGMSQILVAADMCC